MAKLLALSDIHGNVNAVETLVRRVSGNNYDGMIVAGDFTNGLIEGDLLAAQADFEKICDIMRRLDVPLYYVLGNRDYILSQQGLQHVEPSVPTYLDRTSRTRIRLRESYLTANPNLVNRKTIYVTHFDRQLRKEALLQIAGHVHWGVRYRNYLNACFLYRDTEHGAKPTNGCYFELETKGKQVNVKWHDLGGTKKISCAKHPFATYFVPSDWSRCPLCYSKTPSELSIFVDDMPEVAFFGNDSELTRIPMIGWRRASLLDSLGVRSITDAARIDPQKLLGTPEVGNTKDWAFASSLPLIIKYARAIESGKPIITGTSPILIDSSTAPYFADLEYDPVGTKTKGEAGIFVYGVLDSEGNVTQRFLDDPTQERQLLEWFVEWVSKTKPTIFTYASKNADEPHLKNSLRKFRLPPNSLSEARFVDLFHDVIYTQSLVKQRIFLPLEGHIGEKDVSDYFGYREPKNLKIHDGLEALMAYKRYLKSRRVTIKNQILAYNRSDLKRIALIFRRLQELFQCSNSQQ
jgi:predicted phosphodiesterase